MVGLHRWCRVTVVGPGGEPLARYVLQGPNGPDLHTVDTLCRLVLCARRLGGDVIVDDLSPTLVRLLGLAGLGDEVQRPG
jgi:hypothetical protein